MSFEKHSNFNKKANFSEVKFGENMPVLEVELNEMQQIQSEARADIIRDTIPSGFINLGEIDYEYNALNPNQIKMKSQSIAYVHGYRITIPQGTVIDIPETDKECTDLLFLEVWKEIVDGESEIKEYGGENNIVMDNHIKDSRYPIATTQRVALKYRIRHVADMDFDYAYADVVCTKSHPYIGWWNNYDFSKVYAKGGNSDLELPRLITTGQELFRTPLYGWGNLPVIDDAGLWIAGMGTDEDKERFKTVDGFVYAIPMYKLHRKPNTGICSPQEYSKINGQIDAKKFRHLVNKENVEEANVIEVKGNSIFNLHNKYDSYAYNLYSSNSSWYKNLVKTQDSVSFTITDTTDTDWKYINLGELNIPLLKPSTKYMVVFEELVVPHQMLISFKNHQSLGNISTGNGTITRGNDRCIITTTGTIEANSQIIFAHVPNTAGTGDVFIKNVALFEYQDGMENWDKSMFAFNKGVVSVGESENNTISIENNLVAENTYHPTLNNNIIPTFEGYTHLTWGDTIIPPSSVELELKRGEEVLQTITELPVALETVGDEEIHVKSMTGRTLVNLVDRVPLIEGTSNVTVNILPNNKVKATFNRLGSFVFYFKLKQPLKANTKYMFIGEYKHSNTSNRMNPMVSFFDGASFTGDQQPFSTGNIILTPVDYDRYTHLAIGYHMSSYGSVGDTFEINFPVLVEYQEGMENWGLKEYFNGIKSTTAPMIKAVGKNWITNTKLVSGNLSTSTGQPSSNNSFIHTSDYIPVLNNTFTFHVPEEECGLTFYYYSSSKSLLGSKVSSKTSETLTVVEGTKYMKVRTYTSGGLKISTNPNMRIQIESGNEVTTYEPYKEHIFRTPHGVQLRSLPNGVKDSFDFTTGINSVKVGESTYYGTENVSGIFDGGVTGGLKYITIDNYKVARNLKTSEINTYSDTINSIAFADIWSEQNTGLSTSNSDGLGLRISTDSFTDINSFKTWLKDNPLTVHYELRVPYEVEVDYVEDDFVGKSKITYQLDQPLRKIGEYQDYIKGNTLYRHIGKVVFKGDGEDWQTTPSTVGGFYTHHVESKANSPVLCEQLEDISGWGDMSRPGIFRGNSAFGVVPPKGAVADNQVATFKSWLKSNPLVVYYVMETPLEIPLKEVEANSMRLDLERQLTNEYAGCLKIYDENTRDYMANGKSVRNIRHIILNGTEPWTILSSTGNVVRAFTSITNTVPISRVINSYGYPHGTSSTEDVGMGIDQNGNLVVALPKTSLGGIDLSSFKSYIANNPLHILCKAQNPFFHDITQVGVHDSYVPQLPVNSYVGNIYLSNGVNVIKPCNKLVDKVSGYTYHRPFENGAVMLDDVTLKKSENGYKVSYEESLTSSLFNGLFDMNTDYTTNGDGTPKQREDYHTSKDLVYFEEGKTYFVYMEADDSEITSNRRYIYLHRFDEKGNYLQSCQYVGMTTEFQPNFTGYAKVTIRTKNMTYFQITVDEQTEEKVPFVPKETFLATVDEEIVEDIRHQVSMSGFDYSTLLRQTFEKLIKGEL